MKVAVAFTDRRLEGEVMRELRKQGHELVRRCVDLADVDQIAPGIRVYSDETFHSHHPTTILVRSVSDISSRTQRTTRVIGFFGPRGAPGVSTVSLNVAALFPSALFIDVSDSPSVLSMTGQGRHWSGVTTTVAEDIATLDALLQQSTSTVTLLDGGIWSEEAARYCDDIVVVVAAHPISVQRYKDLDIRFPHRLALTRVEGGSISQTAIHLLRDASVIQVPRDDDACERAFIEGQPINVVSPRSEISKGLARVVEALS